MKKASLTWETLTFGYHKTNCHLQYIYRDGFWSEAKICEDDNLTLPIAATCLHYGQECFEGLKVFENPHGQAQVFRVEENARRMIRSAEKICMAPFPEEMFIEAVFTLVNLNREYIPPFGSGASLYIRPLLIGTSPLIGVRPATEYLFVLFCTPVGPYFKSGIRPIKVIVENEIDRAAPLGVGDVKVGGNYAAGLRASEGAKERGYTAVLYLDAKEKKYIDESGPANFFGITKDNKYITPQSTSILPSITNKSLMQLAREMGMTVEQRPVRLEELDDFVEAGCCGTAAVISPIGSVTWGDREIVYSTNNEIGPQSKKLYDKLTSIQNGTEKDPNGWVRVISERG